MSSTATAPPPAESTAGLTKSFRLAALPIDALVPTPENPRHFAKDTAYKELLASIRQDGVLVPLIARPMSQCQSVQVNGTRTQPIDAEGFYQGKSKPHRGLAANLLYDLRAGFRRFMAAREVGLTEVPVLVGDLDDVAALRVTIKENLDRQDLSPLEEAAGVASYKGRGLSNEQIAAEFGRTPGWVARRAHLLNLTEPWRQGIEFSHGTESEHWLSRWPVASLELVAALNAEQQEKLFKELNEGYSHGVRDLRDGKSAAIASHIATEFTNELKRAKWDPDDATLLPKAGPCSGCTNRTGASPLLWEGLNEQPVKAADRCLNPACWKAKAQAYANRELDTLKVKHPDLCVVKASYGADTVAMSAVRKLKLPQYSEHDVRECKATDKGAVPAVKVTSDALWKRIVYVKPTQRSNGDTQSTAAKPAKDKTVKELRTELQQRRETWALQRWSEQHAEYCNEIADKMSSLDDATLLVGLHAFAEYMETPPDPSKVWAKKDVAAARRALHIQLVLAIATRVDDVKLAANLDIQLFADTDVPTIAAILEKSVTEIPEPAGWTEREKAEKGGPARAGKKSGSPIDDAKRESIAQKFEAWAADLQHEINTARAPRDRNTPKKDRQAQAALIHAADVERAQAIMHLLAAQWRAGVPDEPLRSVCTKKAILEGMRHIARSPSYYEVQDTGEYANADETSRALQTLYAADFSPADRSRLDAQVRQDELENKLAALKLEKIPGHFPTPPAVATKMIQLAAFEGLSSNTLVLEPSAGSGDLALAIRRAVPDFSIRCVEVNPRLAEVLKLRGFQYVHCSDFLEFVGIVDCDRILMNPPFEKEQDCLHVRHAHDLLRPGGRLVAVMSAGILSRVNGQAKKFREWLEQVPHEVHQLPADSFKESGTGVNAILVVIDKPAEEGAPLV